jgi:hypothetical protein
MAGPHLLEQTFEARFEKGYRYLDRCGDAMLILEDLLGTDTSRIWMPEDMQPSGARIKCPESETVVSFSTTNLVVTQTPIEIPEEEFGRVCVSACAAVFPRLGISTFIRIGARRKYLFGMDDISGAERASVRLSPVELWPKKLPAGFERTLASHTIEMAVPDRSAGIKVSLTPSFKMGAPLAIDARLRMPPHLLDAGQREVLLEQIRRRKKRAEDPDAGLLCDIDYYRTRPRQPEFTEFLQVAWAAVREQLSFYESRI